MRIWFLPLALATVVAVLAMFRPPVGIANNGDFGKIALPFNLYAPVEDELLFAPVKYTIDPARHWENEFVSSETLFVLPALVMYGIFVLVPLAMTVQYSTLRWNGVGPQRWRIRQTSASR